MLCDWHCHGMGHSGLIFCMGVIHDSCSVWEVFPQYSNIIKYLVVFTTHSLTLCAAMVSQSFIAGTQAADMEANTN